MNDEAKIAIEVGIVFKNAREGKDVTIDAAANLLQVITKARLEELERIDFIPDNLGTKVWAQDVYDFLKRRIAELKGEKHE
jgi:hypothetical protein